MATTSVWLMAILPLQPISFHNESCNQIRFSQARVLTSVARAVSLFQDKSDAVKRMKLPKFKRAVIARVRLEPKDGMMKKTFSGSHYSWWRSAEFDVSQAKVE